MTRGISGRTICFAGLSGAVAVLIAAAAVREPPAYLNDDDLARSQTAVRYQIWRALVLLATAAMQIRRPSKLLVMSAIAFAIGILLFCGGLYPLAMVMGRVNLRGNLARTRNIFVNTT